jgi:glycosyltransferase involved in cell wall biosynthesis
LIATPVGEMEYSLRASGGGLLVPCGDPEALSRAIEALVADPDRASGMGRAGRDWVQAAYSREQFRQRGLAALAAGLGES